MPPIFMDGNTNRPGPAQHGGSQHRPPPGQPYGHQQGQPAVPPVPPAPPRNMIPIDLHGGPAIQMLDISQDFLSQSDMQEELTDYKVFRLEKMPDKDALDEYGQPKWPSWEKVLRTEDRSISKRVAANKIRQLNMTTKGVIDKKNTLTGALKRQIDSTLEHLMNQEPEPVNFCWSLEQIDHQLRRIEPYYPVASSTPPRKHRSTNSFLFPSKKRSHSRGRGSGHHSKKKKTYERISLTLYFKRAPRQGVNIAQLWRDKRRAMAGMYQAQNVFPQMQPSQPQQPQQPQPGPPPNRLPNGPHPDQNTRQHAGGQGRDRKPREMRRSGSEYDSDDSRDSRGSSSGGSRSRTHTPPSSVSDRGHRRGKDRGTHRHPMNGATNQHRPHTPKNDRPVRDRNRLGSSPHFPHISLPPRRSPRAPGPPYPVSQDSGSVASHIERIRQDAYRRGQLRERADARLAEELAFTNAHDRARPHVVQERRPLHPRRVYRGPDDLDVPRYFSGLSLGDDDYEDDEYEDDQYRREFERRKLQGSILEDDPFDLNPPSSSSYTYSTDAGIGWGRRRGPQIIEIPQSPRLRRRPSYFP